MGRIILCLVVFLLVSTSTLFASTPSSSPSNFAVLDSTIYFTCNDGIHGLELWQSKGTPETTRIFLDLTPGADGSFPSNLIVIEKYLYFNIRVAGDTTKYQLWRTDGTKGGTIKLLDRWGSGFTRANGTILFFTANNELAKTDGTLIGTSIIRQLDDTRMPGGSPLNESIRVLGSVAGKLIFGSYTDATGYEVWKSDGTPAGTTLLKDIYPGPESSDAFSFTSSTTPVNGKLLFSADDGIHGRELWESDGTTAGTYMVKNIGQGGEGSSIFYPFPGMVFHGYLYFSATTQRDVPVGSYLWRSDASKIGTRRFANPDPTSFKVSGNLLFFLSGYQLWVTDGTESGTKLVKDFMFGQMGTELKFLVSAGDFLCFLRIGRLWSSDGSPKLNTLLSDQLRVSRLGRPYSTPFGKYLVFAGTDDLHGTELWRSDGTSSGTKLIKDIAR